MPTPQAVLYSHGAFELPAAVRGWMEQRGLPSVRVGSGDDLVAMALRGRPRVILMDASEDPEGVIASCHRMKADSYTGVVPIVVVVPDDEDLLVSAFTAGADEVLRTGMRRREVLSRLELLLRRSDRDVHVHPTTRLGGTVEIEGEISRRIAGGETFAVCYADLDHFKEFNDRYSYYDGDRVIKILSHILHDVAKGICGERAFVGHIGGDDFIFIISAVQVAEVCSEIVNVFDLLIPYQYSDQDRRAGYFFGKDRRGQLHRVPLMTLSIGVVTNERRHFTVAAQVSELATEMKGYAKTLAGSVYSVDRRQDQGSSSEATPPRSQPPISMIDS